MDRIKRYTIPDMIRGIAVICMVVYHAMWDIVFIHNVDFKWFSSDSAEVFQNGIRWCFLIVSGFCWSMGKHHLKRGLMVLAGSALITLFTALFTPENTIIFGVLTLIGTAMLVLIPLDKVFKKVNPFIGIILSFLVFAFTYNTELGSMGFGEHLKLELPRSLFKNYFTAFFGFKPRSFESPDFVPILPWLFLVFVGYFLYHIFRRFDLLKYLSAFSFKPLEWVGRNALIIYMLHQPVIYGALHIFFRIIK